MSSPAFLVLHRPSLALLRIQCDPHHSRVLFLPTVFAPALRHPLGHPIEPDTPAHAALVARLRAEAALLDDFEASSPVPSSTPASDNMPANSSPGANASPWHWQAKSPAADSSSLDAGVALATTRDPYAVAGEHPKQTDMMPVVAAEAAGAFTEPDSVAAEPNVEGSNAGDPLATPPSQLPVRRCRLDGNGLGTVGRGEAGMNDEEVLEVVPEAAVAKGVDELASALAVRGHAHTTWSSRAVMTPRALRQGGLSTAVAAAFPPSFLVVWWQQALTGKSRTTSCSTHRPLSQSAGR